MTLCEGGSSCDASGLKSLLPHHCEHLNISKRLVSVTYVCVPENQMLDSCVRMNRSAPLTTDFGVILSPGYSNSYCRWTVNPYESGMVQVVVHLVRSLITSNPCQKEFIQVRYKDCESKKPFTKSFCSITDINQKLLSCGPVKIISKPKTNLEYNDKFVVSFQRLRSKDRDVFIPGLPVCIAPPAYGRYTPPSLATNDLQPSDHDTSLTEKHDKVSGGSRAIFNLRTQLYLVFGFIILALIIALIVVFVRYRRMSTVKTSRGDSGEKTALWRQHEDTALETFDNSQMMDNNSPHTCSSEHLHVDQVIATIHHDGSLVDNRTSTGSGISTFLATKRDSDFRELIDSFQTGHFDQYATVTDNQDSGTYTETQGSNEIRDPMYISSKNDYSSISDHYAVPNNNDDIYEVIDGAHKKSTDSGDKMKTCNKSITKTNDLTSSPSDDNHFIVNNDEYAIVKKSGKTSADSSPYLKKSSRNMLEYENCQNKKVQYCPYDNPNIGENNITQIYESL